MCTIRQKKIRKMLFKMVNLRSIFFLVLLPIGYDDYSCQSLEFEKIPIVISSFQAISILIDFKSVANEHFSPFQIRLIVCFNEMRDKIYL